MKYGAYIILLILSLGPIFAVDIPAMVDYPNHLARMHLLSRDGTAAANKFYQVTWGLYPNLAMDLVVPLLARLMSVETATKTFLLVSQLLVISGALTLERVVKGRVEIAPLAVAMFLYTFPFALGFVNFEFGFGVALWAIIGWLTTRNWPWGARIAAHCAFVAILFVAHFFALGIYGAVIGLHELWRAQSRQSPLKELLFTLTMLAAPAIVLLSAMLHLGGSIGGKHIIWHFTHKPIWLVRLMSGYSQWLSAIGMYLIITASIILALRGRLRLKESGSWIAVGFAFLFFIIPFRLFDTAFADVRILSAAAFILPAFVSLSLPGASWRWCIGAVAATLAVANLALVWFAWLSYRSEYRAMINSFEQIAKGSTVLVASSGEGEDPPKDLLEYPIHHAPTLAVAYADALVPTLFTYPGKQPLTEHQAYRHLDLAEGGPVPVIVLQAISSGRLPSRNLPSDIKFIGNWTSDFDYLYIVGPRIPNPMPHLLSELAAGPRFVLYRIGKAPGRSAVP